MRLVLLLVVSMLLGCAAPPAGGNVGFSELKVADGDDAPLVVGVWYPSQAAGRRHRLGPYVQAVAADGAPSGGGLPLVIISHGHGGSYQNHYDTALALAEAGFVVAAVSHTGDTYDDQSRAMSMIDRPRHVRRVIDYILAEWPAHARIDPRRVGIYGFSSGGFTALVSVGGKPDLSLREAHARAHPNYYDARLAKQARSDGATSRGELAPDVPALVDPRIRAAVVAAPALGFTFEHQGLTAVTVPVQLWRAENDHILPEPDYAEAVRLALPHPPEIHLVENGDHFDFLAPCTIVLRTVAPEICVSRPGFDREAFHRTFNREVVRFFNETLR